MTQNNTIPDDILQCYIQQLLPYQEIIKNTKLQKILILHQIYLEYGHCVFPNSTTFFTYWNTHPDFGWKESYIRKNIKFAEFHAEVEGNVTYNKFNFY